MYDPIKLKNPPKKYRPIPFWSWNEKLDTEETRRQIALMDEAGIGGYFMHARGGLQTEYMGDEWFDNISAGVDEGKKRGMGAWAYDENGWPSGFGNGLVNGLGVEYQQKYLRMEPGESNTETTIANCGGYHFYYEVNPFYVDALDPKVIKEFIERIYEPYFEKYQGNMPGFFTDEPQLSRSGIPWSMILPEEYEKAYGEDLLQHLHELFLPEGNYRKTRLRFWRLVTILFREAFTKQIYTWCSEHNMQLTGHMVLEESMFDQLTTNGAVMPHYEYFHIPGMDWLGREYITPLTPLQVSSVAHQTGKKQVLSETFALTGWNVSLEEFKWLYEGQMVRGVTLLCPHLEGYSIRGIRKRDYPPCIFYQEPWWEQYHQFTDAMSRVGMLLSEGETNFDTLLIHPQSTAWVLFDNGANQGLESYDAALSNAVKTLEEKHIFFDLGDEIMMEERAYVEDGKLVLGKQRYSTVVLPPHEILFESTEKLLEEFRLAGGTVITPEEAETNRLVDNPNITCTRRIFPDFDMYYFVNGTKEEQKTAISKGTQMLEILSGELKPFDGQYVFPPMGSLIVFDDRKHEKAQTQSQTTRKVLALDGKWKIRDDSDFNALTLDYCDYWFDGELIEKHGHVNNIQGRACDLGRPVTIVMEFSVKVETVPKEAYLVCETPEIFTISVNGKTLSKIDKGTYLDPSMRKLDLEGSLRTGNNQIRLEVAFAQSKQIYENIEKSKVFESEKNKLTYDMEIECIYLIGQFSVSCGSFTALEREAVRTKECFSLAEPNKEVMLANIEQQGYPFFAGVMTLEKEFELSDTQYGIRFHKKNVNVVKVRVNGKDAGIILWRPYELDLSPYLKAGKNLVELTLYGSLRNLLGPHHLEEGESYCVSPATFFQDETIWGNWGCSEWNPDYCLVHFGLQ